jgi:hypothetical protein
MYSLGRLDSSGSVLTDMLYAHAYAHAHNLTYGGACYNPRVRGFPKRDTRHLLRELRLDRILPFACPPSAVEAAELHPNATQLSPLILPDYVYRDTHDRVYFTESWRSEIQKSMLQLGTMTTTATADGHQTKDDGRRLRPFEIAVHVRWGKVTPCRYRRRYLTNDHYLHLIERYSPPPERLDGRPVRVTIYSESESFESRDAFRDRGYALELDTPDLAAVWRAMATADVVILSRSSFPSYRPR